HSTHQLLLHLLLQLHKFFFFFFQAEDGIRDDLVTGVQTCALPICHRRFRRKIWTPITSGVSMARLSRTSIASFDPMGCTSVVLRSEERRVGKSVDLGGRRVMRNKKR